MESITDQELIQKYLEGDEAALAELVERYVRPLYNFVRRFIKSRETSEDIVQETWLKCWRALKRYDPKKSFRTWLFQIAKNTAFDYLRKREPLVFASLSEPDEAAELAETIPDPRPSLIQELKRAEIKNNVQALVDHLPPKYRVVVGLYYTDDLTLREIAEVLKEPLDTVKSRHRRALLRLKELILHSDAP